jgi:hypothetical protein
MLKRFPLAASIILLLGSTAAWAQDRNAMTTLNAAIRGQWVQFNIVGGRVNLQGAQVGPIQTGPPVSTNRKDQLNIRTENGETSMTYEWLNAKDQFTIDACGSVRVCVRRVPKNDPQGTTVEFAQKPQGKSVLTLETEGKQQVLAGDSLWHLFILYPDQARRYLAPLMQTLQPSWKLAETADAIEKELLRNADNTLVLDRSNWSRWVAQLGDENFARRQAADRALRAANPALLVYLQQLDFERLDAEQQFRIRRIIETLSVKISSDTPEQVASWMTGDPEIWLAFLSRPDVATRRIAAKQLAAMLEGPIPVDPAADPASQKAQFDQLRAQLEAKGEQK